MKRSTTPRRNWPRIPVPEEMFDLLIILAKAQGYDEKTLYLFIYKMLKEANPANMEALINILNTNWLDSPDAPAAPNAESPDA